MVARAWWCDRSVRKTTAAFGSELVGGWLLAIASRFVDGGSVLFCFGLVSSCILFFVVLLLYYYWLCFQIGNKFNLH